MKKLILILFIIFTVSVYAQEEPLPAIEEKGIEVYLFVSKSCKACIKFQEDIRPGIEQLYGDKFYFTEFDVHEPDNYKKLAALAKLNSLKPAYPAVYVGRQLLIGNKKIQTELPVVLELMIKKNIKSVNVDLNAVETIDETFSSFNAVTVAGAGLLDGINPCAFTVIVFFISFLAAYGYRRKHMLVIGLSYVSAVFAAYLALGIGIFNFLYSLKGFYTVIRYFYYMMSALCALLAALSLLDFISFKRTGSTRDSFLQLSDGLKSKIRAVIGNEFRDSGNKGVLRIAAGSFGVGILVSVLEAACTGQVYLPVISFVLKNPQMRLKAVAYLVLYNFMFILPLVMVFLLSLWGVSNERFAVYYRSRYGFVRICMFILFMFLAFFMLLG